MNEPDRQSRPTLAPRVRLRDDPVSGQTVLLYPEGLLELSETAQAIVTRCDGVRSIDEIVRTLAAEYEAGPEDIAPDVVECLKDLRQRNLIVFQP